MNERRVSKLVWIACGALAASACATGAMDREAPFAGEVRAVSTNAASLGAVIDLYGVAFPEPEAGRVSAVLEGVYERDDGLTEAVSKEIVLRRVDDGTLRWTGFGPYAVPFGATGDALGRFIGTVRLRLLTPEGQRLDSAVATPMELRVLPSILVRELQPRMARCGGPVRRALGGLPYRMAVQTVGFRPVTLTYTLSVPALDHEESVRHVASETVDVVGDDGGLVLPQVPDGAYAYGAIFTIEAVATDGRTHRTAFAIGVHRPMEVAYDGNVDIAEIFEAVPVSACIPGGEAGREVDYTETTTETRTRTYGLSWSEGWLEAHTVSHSESQTTSRTETNTVGFSTTNGSSFNWSVGTEVSGGFDIAGLVEVGAKVNGSIGGTRFSQSTRSRERSVSETESETTTDTTSATEQRSGESGEQFQWQVSSAEALGRGFRAHVIAGTWGVFYRQTVRMIRRASIVTYDLCGAGDVVGEVDLEDWTWASDLALGEACPPLPRSNLPRARCDLPPCSGDDR